MFKRLLSFVLSICLICSCFIMTDNMFVKSDAVTNEYGLVDNVQDGQILQCWNWSFNNIKNNMAKIAAQGFSAVQTSPIQASKESTKESWSTASNSFWVYYQPINFSIETNTRSALGTKTEFKAMCEEAEKYGVKVIVDTVFNHLANGNSGNTLNSQIPSDIKDDSSCWHTITTNTSNYSDRYDITHNCLSGLPDLNTGNSKIQNYAISFLKECIDCGADGFRFDAAKHIETPTDYSGTSSDFWPNVLNAATSYAESTYGVTPYYYGEILDSTGGVDITAYTNYMSVTDNQGSNSIRNAVNSSNSGSAANSAIFNGAQPKNTVQWNESHDTYSEGSSSNVSDTALKKTWAIVGSRAQVCGMYLARPSSGSTMLGNADVTAWADKEVRAINQFKNAFVGQSEYFASSGNIAYNERGTSGVVLVNVSGGSTSVSVTANKIASGTYTDAISGNTFTVSNGKINGNIGDTGIAVVYNPSETTVPDTPTQSSTSSTVSGETKTVYVGVIEYITELPTLHYWNESGLTGDAQLVSLNEVKQYSVGDSYWSNAAQNFNIYKAEIPAEATSYKTYTATSNSNWADESVTYSENAITLVFEWGGTYHNTTAEYSVVEPTEEETKEPTEAPTEEPTEEPTVEPTAVETEQPTDEPTEQPSGDDTKTVYIGVIEYLTDIPTLHYWNYDGLSGDAELTVTGEVKQFSVGDAYWSNAAQNFNIYKAEIPALATNMKTYNASSNSNWAEEDVAYADNQILLLFEWSGIYHNTTAQYSIEEPTVVVTQSPTNEETVATSVPTTTPTDSSGLDENKVYVLVDGKYYEVEKGQSINYNLCITLDSSVSISSLDVQTNYDTDGLDFVPVYDEYGDVDTTTIFPKLPSVVYNFGVDGSIIYNYSNVVGARFTNDDVVFNGTFTVTADSGIYEIESLIKCLADSDNVKYVFEFEKLLDYGESQLLLGLTPVDNSTNSTEAPTQPQITKVENVNATAGTVSATLTWDSLDTAVKYWIYKYNNNTSSWSCIASTTTTSYTVNGLDPLTEYKFKVCYNGSDYKISAIDEADEISIATERVANVETISGVPGLVDADITWGEVDGAVKYWIYKAWDENGPFYCYDATTSTDYKIRRLQADTDYYIKVITVTESNGTQVLSKLDDAPTLHITTQAAENITVTLDDITTTTATISWPAFENAEKYWIKYSNTTKDVSKEDQWVTYTETTDTTYTFNNLKKNTTYYFTVVAKYPDEQTGYEVANYIAVDTKTMYSDSNFLTFEKTETGGLTVSWPEDVNSEKSWMYVYDNEGNLVVSNGTTTNSVSFSFAADWENYTYSLKTLDADSTARLITPALGYAYIE